MYSRQLHAYAYTLEHPAPDKLALSPVTELGLLYFYPDKISTKIASAGLIMELKSSG